MHYILEGDHIQSALSHSMNSFLQLANAARVMNLYRNHTHYVSLVYLDIHEFYTYTLEDHSKSTEIKTEETLKLAERWEQHPPPVPSDHIEIAKRSLEIHMVSHTLSVSSPYNTECGLSLGFLC